MVQLSAGSDIFCAAFLKMQYNIFNTASCSVCIFIFATSSLRPHPQREAPEAAEAAAKAKGKDGDAASGSGWLRHADSRAANVFLELPFRFAP